MMKDFLTVKEFSKLSGIEQTTLRYWDEIGLFSPARRDPFNNYRYYSPEQIIAVNFITVLSSLNIPLKAISAMESQRTPESILNLVEQQEKLLDMEMCRLRESYSIVHTRQELINYGYRLINGQQTAEHDLIENGVKIVRGQKVDESNIGVYYRDNKAYILGPPNEFGSNEDFYEPFMRFCRKADELRINLNYPICGYHDKMESFVAAAGRPERFCSLDPTGNRCRKEGDYLVGFHRGFYSQFGDLPERMAAFAKENNLTTTGPVYTIYLHDEICIKEPSQYLVEVCVAIA